MNNYKLVITTDLLKYASGKGLSTNELLLLVYFDNVFDKSFNIDLISKVISISKEDVYEAFNELLTKGIIDIKTEKDASNKIVDNVVLSEFYNNNKVDNDDIFSILESTIGKTLSSSEIEIINIWKEKNYSNELILCALEDASYNGIVTIRYIDRLLHEWNKKGIKNKEDVINNKKNQFDIKTVEDTSIFKYNWLEDYET